MADEIDAAPSAAQVVERVRRQTAEHAALLRQRREIEVGPFAPPGAPGCRPQQSCAACAVPPRTGEPE